MSHDQSTSAQADQKDERREWAVASGFEFINSLDSGCFYIHDKNRQDQYDLESICVWFGHI